MNYEVKIDVSPIYELLGSFMVYVSNKWVDNLDMGPGWVHNVEQRLNPEIRSILATASAWPFSDYDVLYVWAGQRHNGNSIEAFLEQLLKSSDIELFDRVSPYLPTLALVDARRIRDDYVPVLKLWYEHYFKEIEDEIIPLIEEDALEKRTLLSKMDPENLIEYASGGLVIEDIPGLNTVVLFPTVHNRPINTYCFYTGMLLIQYPVDVPEKIDDEPPMCLTRMTYALSNSTRLRILRYVGEQPKSLMDMKHELDQPVDTLMHHLMILRVAGLLRIHLGEHNNDRFSIRAEGAAELQIFLESYIRL
ncbi:winged helix-turn-helix domain-containing protein [Paenibacillus sp. IHBB 10380]|uniref:winged helix-turn-helix domain-containing protein n=1 Tax=Paenibacillus sp. IHBB 10380 TaxID=1566358 RepID=UPI0005CFA057|nr:helix-turn-helix domain-containing protein [Paenibacillus sp. IHBB 10380]AJS58369.1 ArsR family transcriptional regulator [Paenibacillus sp. IHBB 10380]